MPLLLAASVLLELTTSGGITGIAVVERRAPNAGPNRVVESLSVPLTILIHELDELRGSALEACGLRF